MAVLVVMPVITSHAFAPHLLSLLRIIFSTQQTVVFKFCDTLMSIAVCMAYPYDSNIWEVGLLHTVESERRMGHGRAVAGAALGWVLATGRIPRLQAGWGDATLAGSLNMVKVVHFAHYLKPSEPEL